MLLSSRPTGCCSAALLPESLDRSAAHAGRSCCWLAPARRGRHRSSGNNARGSGSIRAHAPLRHCMSSELRRCMAVTPSSAQPARGSILCSSSSSGNGSMASLAAGPATDGAALATGALQRVLNCLGLPSSVDDASTLLGSLRGMSIAQQQAFLQHAPAVAAYLRSPAVGLGEAQLALLLDALPCLFGWPAQQAAHAFAPLLAKGLSPAEAARCLVAFRHDAAAVEGVPAGLLNRALVLREELGMELRDTLHLVEKEQRKLAGLQAAQAPCARAGCHAWLTLNPEALQTHARALAEAFGADSAAYIVRWCPDTLASSPAVWQRSLLCLMACGVEQPASAFVRSPPLLCWDHAAPAAVAERLLLQRCLGLTAAQVYERHPEYLRLPLAPASLAQRLQYVEAAGQLPRLASTVAAPRRPLSVAVAADGSQSSQQQQQPQQRPLTLRSVASERLEDFLAELGSSRAEWEAWEASHPAASTPLWLWAQREAAQEVRRLVAALPPELQPAGGSSM